MRKLFMSIVAAMFTLFAIAADDSAVARITLTGTSSGGSCQLILIENADYSAAYDNGYDALCNINLAEALPKTLYMYSYIGANKYSTIATNNLDNLEFGFISNLVDDEYTMTFEVFTMAPGRSLTVHDVTTGDDRLVDPGTNYTFSAASGRTEYMRFVINPAAVVTSLTTNEDGWASFAYGSSDIVLAYPSGLTIYKGALDITDPENPAINLTAVSAVPAGEGVFVKGAPLTTYYFSATTAAALSDNDIVGCAAATPVSNFGTAAIYTLRNVGGVTALYHYEGTTDIPAGKAVLPISLGGAPAPKRVIMRIDGTQAVENISLEPVNSQKLIKNGQILIQRGDAVYNLQGQMVK